MVNNNDTKRKCHHKRTDANTSENASSYDDFTTICLIWTGLFWILQNRPQEKCHKCGRDTIQIATELKSVLLKLYKKTSLDPNNFERSLSLFEQFYDCFTNNEPTSKDKSQQTISENVSSNSSVYSGTFMNFFQNLIRSFTNTVFGFIPQDVLEENTTILTRCPENVFQETVTTATSDKKISISQHTITDDFNTNQIKNESHKSMFKESTIKFDVSTSNLSAKCTATEEKLLQLAEEVNVMNLTVRELSKQQSLHNKNVAAILSSLKRMEMCFRSCKCKENSDTTKPAGSKSLISNKNSGSKKSLNSSPKHSTEILNTNLDIDERQTQTRSCRCLNNNPTNNKTSRNVAADFFSLGRPEFSEKELYGPPGNVQELKEEVDTLNFMLEKIITNSRKQYDDMIVTSSELVHKLQKSYNARVKYVHSKYARRLEAIKRSITSNPGGKQGNVDNPRRPVKYSVRDVKIKF